MPEKMRVAVGQSAVASHEVLTLAKQLGCSGVQLNNAQLPGSQRWEYYDLFRLRRQVEGYGLKIESLENVPNYFFDKAMLGLPGRDEQIEHYQATIRNIGQAGIPVLGLHWMPNHVWRTNPAVPDRGGATFTLWDSSLEKDDRFSHGRVFTAEDMWANFDYFMKAVIPVAEEAGVRLALHPDDPPVPSLGGVARIFHDFEGFARAIEMVPSPNFGLNFCMGCWSEMRGGKGVIEAIEYFGSRNKIVYCHFRDVKGTADRFQECFLGEGNVNVVEAMRAFKRVGFTGFFIDDHVPHMDEDTPWGHRGRALATGYIMGLLEASRQRGDG